MGLTKHYEKLKNGNAEVKVKKNGPVEVREADLNVANGDLYMRGIPFITGGSIHTLRTSGKNIEVYDSANSQQVMKWSEGGPIQVANGTNLQIINNGQMDILASATKVSLYNNGAGEMIGQDDAGNTTQLT